MRGLAARIPVELGALLALVILAAAAPLVISGFVVSILTLMVIAAILAGSVNMLAGQVGLVSLGHAGIAATAAYGVAWANVRGHDGLGQLAVGIGLTATASVVYGLMTMRSRGIVFLMISLALGMIVFGLALRLASVTGGQNGLTGIGRPDIIESPTTFHLVAVAIFGLVAIGLWIAERSPFGLAMRGVRDSETRMASLGYPVGRVKFQAMLLSGSVAGVAGILAVWHSEFMSPATASFASSASVVVMVILGGVGTLLGPVVGAAVVVGTEHLLSSYVERWPTLLGAVFILVVMLAPRGLLGELSAAVARRARSSRSPFATSPVAGSPPPAVGADRQSPEKEEP